MVETCSNIIEKGIRMKSNNVTKNKDLNFDEQQRNHNWNMSPNSLIKIASKQGF